MFLHQLQEFYYHVLLEENFNYGIWFGIIIGLPVGFALSELKNRKGK